MCVYTFGSHTNDLDRVFDGKYSKRTGLSNFETVDNPTPFTVSWGEGGGGRRKRECVGEQCVHYGCLLHPHAHTTPMAVFFIHMLTLLLQCSTTRSLEDANDLHLMQSVAVQSSESIPVLQLTGYNLRQIAVTSTLDVDGLYREVMFIAGEKGGVL